TSALLSCRCFQFERFHLNPVTGANSEGDIDRGFVPDAAPAQFRPNSYRRYIESFGNYSIRIDSALEVIIASGAVQFSGQHNFPAELFPGQKNMRYAIEIRIDANIFGRFVLQWSEFRHS